MGITSGVTGLAGGQAVLGEDGVLVCAAQRTHKQVSVNRRGGCFAVHDAACSPLSPGCVQCEAHAWQELCW